MYLKIKIFNIDMATLAIKGHKTRGREVIEILEMLGVKNKSELLGNSFTSVYFIEDEEIRCEPPIFIESIKQFTLEEFLEKFPYKVGDKVSSKYLKNYKFHIEKMEWEDTNNRVIYKLQGMGWYSVRELQPYKEEDMETITIDDFKANTKEWLIDKLESMSKDNALQAICNIHDELHKLKYPKTFIEVLNFWHPDRQPEDNYQRCYKKDLIEKFQDLLYARAAYWKIAGEQMGLGKPWKPDWKDDEQFKYIIICRRGCIIRDTYTAKDVILAFPTEEMRDAFYENFKDLIEECKEFL